MRLANDNYWRDFIALRSPRLSIRYALVACRSSYRSRSPRQIGWVVMRAAFDRRMRPTILTPSSLPGAGYGRVCGETPLHKSPCRWSGQFPGGVACA